MADTGTFTNISSEAVPSATDTISFKNTYVARPRMPVALTMLDISNTEDITIRAKVDDITKTGFTIETESWGNTKRHGTSASWMELAPYNIEYQNGEVAFDEPQKTSVINFGYPFVTPPKVAVFLNAMAMGKNKGWHILVNATDVTTTGFNLNLKTWGDSDFGLAEVVWVAFPADRPNVYGNNARTEYKPSTRETSGTVNFGSTFSKVPKVFYGFKSISLGNDGDLKIKGCVDNVTQTGFTWHLNAMEGGGTFYSAALSFIAFV